MRRATNVLEPGGICVLNAVASAGVRRLDEDTAAMAAMFNNTIATVDPAVFSGKHFGNFVVVGSDVRFLIEAIGRGVSRFSLLTKSSDDGVLCSHAVSTRPLTDSPIE